MKLGHFTFENNDLEQAVTRCIQGVSIKRRTHMAPTFIFFWSLLLHLKTGETISICFDPSRSKLSQAKQSRLSAILRDLVFETGGQSVTPTCRKKSPKKETREPLRALQGRCSRRRAAVCGPACLQSVAPGFVQGAGRLVERHRTQMLTENSFTPSFRVIIYSKIVLHVDVVQYCDDSTGRSGSLASFQSCGQKGPKN